MQNKTLKLCTSKFCILPETLNQRNITHTSRSYSNKKPGKKCNQDEVEQIYGDFSQTTALVIYLTYSTVRTKQTIRKPTKSSDLETKQLEKVSGGKNRYLLSETEEYEDMSDEKNPMTKFSKRPSECRHC